MINVEMLSTGDEVLHGQIIDTNAAWLADLFFEQGLPLTRRNTVGDNLDSLVNILRERSEHADVLIVNGGLGPTSDDLSALAAATAKGEELVLHGRSGEYCACQSGYRDVLAAACRGMRRPADPESQTRNAGRSDPG